MSAIDIGRKLVQLCNEGRDEEVVQEFYSPGIISIEGADSPEMPARLEGLEAVRQKAAWFFGNNEIHAATASGPFVGLRDDQFAVKFDMDLTPKDGERTQLSEMALYTVRDGKIVQEEFLYQI